MLHFFAFDLRKLAVLLGAFFAFALLTACSPQTPESVVSSYIKAVASNNVDEAMGYLALGDVKGNEFTQTRGKIRGMLDSQYSAIQENGGLDSISTKLINKNDNIAHVKLTMKYKNGKTESGDMTLVKESGEWKISLG